MTIISGCAKTQTVQVSSPDEVADIQDSQKEEIQEIHSRDEVSQGEVSQCDDENNENSKEPEIKTIILEHEDINITLKEPWTLNHFNQAINAVDGDNQIELLSSEKNNDGKVYLVKAKEGGRRNTESIIYLGIRDYDKNNQMVVNFFYINWLEEYCGTTTCRSEKVSMSPPAIVDYQSEKYLEIEVKTTINEEFTCAPDDYYYDEETGERDWNSCYAVSEEHIYIEKFLYKYFKQP